LYIMKVKYNSTYKYDLRTSKDDVGYDLRTPWPIRLRRGEEVKIDTGIVVDTSETPYWFMITPRSSSAKKEMYIANTIGIVDKGYNGKSDHLFVVVGRRRTAFSITRLADEGWGYLKEFFFRKNMYEIGDRFAQIVFMPFIKPELEEVGLDSLPDKSRGGFGSTGSK